MSIESVMPSNHLVFCNPLLLLPSIFPGIRIFSNESVIHIMWQISQPGDLTKGLRIPREFDYAGQWDLIIELTQDWGNRQLEGTALCALGLRRKEQRPQKRLTQTCLWVSRRFQWKCGLMVSCCRVGGIECSSACMGPFEGGHHYFHYLHHSFVSGQTTQREHSHTHHQETELKIYWAWPYPSE